MANVKVLASTLEKATKNAEAVLAEVRTALRNKDLGAYDAGMKKLQKEVKDVNTVISKVEYTKFLATKNPILTAVSQFFIETYKIKELRDKKTGLITGVQTEKRKSRVDLEDLCKFGNLDTKWVADASKLLALLALREQDAFKMPASELAKKSDFFIRMANAKKEGATPDSNRQIVMLLQQIVNEMLFDGKDGEYKCTVHDLLFIHDAITKMDAKEKCTVATMNDRQFRTVLMSVLAHCLGEKYAVTMQKSKKDNVEAELATEEAPKVEATPEAKPEATEVGPF